VHQEQTAQLVKRTSGDSGAAINDIGDQLRSIAERKVWLPTLFYESLPVIYILVGVIALLSTLFNRHWSWLLPHMFLLGCFLVHMGVVVRRSRRRARSAGAEPR
jgi:hypothetical protein